MDNGATIFHNRTADLSFCADFRRLVVRRGFHNSNPDGVFTSAVCALYDWMENPLSF